MENYVILIKLSVVLLLIISCINGEVELCSDGASHVYQITSESCPFGVLFVEPQTADCVKYSEEDESSIMADVCTKEPYNATKKLFQYFPEISAEMIDPENSCKTTRSSMCSMPLLKVRSSSFLRRLSSEDLKFGKESNDTNVIPIKDQTMRMFEYMMGLGNMDLDDSLRLVALLRKSFEIFKKFCDPDFLRPEFYEDVESAFLFLLNEADLTAVVDVPVEEFNRIMKHLIDCADQKNPLQFMGRRCATHAQIQRVNKSGILFSEFETTHHDAFSKYDLPVEATWGAVDFVHGLCYGTFRDHINSHHLYQQALEKLFTKEILYRWTKRYVLLEQSVWNNFFSANVKNALINMDKCIQASYLSTPFLHRLDRPIDPRTKIRKRRWAEAHSLIQLNNVEGYCFQKKDDADAVIAELCPA